LDRPNAAKAAGVSLRSVQRILEPHQLAPHRIRTFKLSNDPKFAEKLRDIVGLYVDSPAHAIVLSVDEKSQTRRSIATQPGLPTRRDAFDMRGEHLKKFGQSLTHDRFGADLQVGTLAGGPELTIVVPTFNERGNVAVLPWGWHR
jgi:hypothetical protein